MRQYGNAQGCKVRDGWKVPNRRKKKKLRQEEKKHTKNTGHDADIDASVTQHALPVKWFARAITLQELHWVGGKLLGIGVEYIFAVLKRLSGRKEMGWGGVG